MPDPTKSELSRAEGVRPITDDYLAHVRRQDWKRDRRGTSALIQSDLAGRFIPAVLARLDATQRKLDAAEGRVQEAIDWFTGSCDAINGCITFSAVHGAPYRGKQAPKWMQVDALATSPSEDGSVECDCGNPAVVTPDGQHHVFCASLNSDQGVPT